ncbi:MAG: ABC transporter permease [Deltaproteobacteria bacterium]|nr:MAG: ABC transporter permease [Deltaproteobacteria bacterium]
MVSLEPLRAIGRLAQLTWQSLCCVGSLRRAEVLEHACEVSYRSAFFACTTMAFVGAILVMQAAGQAENLLGDTSPIGAAFLQLLVSEFGPLVSSILVAGRFGAGVAASLAGMVVTEQVDALRLCGAAPVPYLLAPRVWGTLLGMVPVVTLATATSWAAGACVATGVYGIGLDVFASTQQTTLGDLWLGLSKALLFGVAIPVVSGQAGLGAGAGAEAVGEATTRAVIRALVTLLVLDFALSLLAYGMRR